MKAIILAAGRATRLRPITHDLPKCLLTVGTKTILDFQLDTLTQNGVTDVIIVTGFKAEKIREHVAGRTAKANITFVHSEDYATTGAAYSLWMARDHLTEATIYLNSDLICDPAIFKKLIDCPHESATAVHRNTWDEEEVNVIVDTEGKVIEIGKHISQEKSWGEFIGATKLSKEFLGGLIRALEKNISHGNTNIFAVDAINSAINEFGQTLYALDITEHVAIEIDTIQDFENGKLLWQTYEKKNTTTILSKLATLIITFTARPLYILSHLFPRDPNLWVFIGWHGREGKEIFADNTKYLFLHTSNNHPKIQAVWLARDRTLAKELTKHGYRSYYHQSLRGIWYALRAGVTHIDAYLQPKNFRWSGRTVLVQLLHGKGMKKGGYSTALPRPQDYIFCPSPFARDMLAPKFVGKATIKIAGYSRDAIFFESIPGSEIHVDTETQKHLTSRNYKKRILYAPTFRRGSDTAPLHHILDSEHLELWLAEHNYVLMLNLHPKYLDQARSVESEHIHLITDSDIYPLLPSFDVLITDYSSIFTDFLLLDKPIIFYPYDLEEYTKKEGLTRPYDEITPGEKIRTAAEIIPALERSINNDAWRSERERVRTLYHTHIDGKASERIISTLLSDSRISKKKPRG